MPTTDIQELVDEFNENGLQDAAEHLRDHGIEATIDFLEGELADYERNGERFGGMDPGNMDVALERLHYARAEERRKGSQRESRFITPTEADGTWIEAKLTSEGVIVDRYNSEGECIATFGQTYDEILPEG